MKTNYITKKGALKVLAGIALFISSTNSYASIKISSDFEENILSENSFWNGSDMSGGFNSGKAYFRNKYDSTYDYWSGGFSYSNMKDVTTAGYTNPFSAFAGGGFNGSKNYATAYGKSTIVLNQEIKGSIISGFYVTNNTYAALSMKNGDSFSKKFGGVSGNDADWFKLSVVGYLDGNLKSDTVHFYLADFRSADNAKDYILDTWKWVDLTPLGDIDSLTFSLSSSDVGQWGMNTPAYFSMDNFNGDAPAGQQSLLQESTLRIFPNPAVESLNISLETPASISEIKITDLLGNVVYHNMNFASGLLNIPVSNLQNGAYLISILSNNKATSYHKFVKQ